MREAKSLSAGGRIQLWSYSAGHGLLLFRRVVQNGYSTRFDIGFKNTVHIDAPCVFDGMLIVEGTEADLSADFGLGGVLGVGGKTVYRIDAGKYKGLVIADQMLFAEDAREYFEPSSLEGF